LDEFVTSLRHDAMNFRFVALWAVATALLRHPRNKAFLKTSFGHNAGAKNKDSPLRTTPNEK